VNGKKNRVSLSVASAAQVLFWSDRTCCVCREPAKEVQIHHIDENPANNDDVNLCVLCFDCHNKTQLKGGFGRKLDADQVRLFRDDWLRTVRNKRAAVSPMVQQNQEELKWRIRYATEIAEIYLEQKDYQSLAFHYAALHEEELRDKYIERAIAAGADDEFVCFFRHLQGKPIPSETAEREIRRLTSERDVLNRARLYCGLGKYREAALDYMRGITKSLETNRAFAAAFYLKEASEAGIIEHLLRDAFRDAAKKKDLWWQWRALEELGDPGELNAFLLSRATQIERSRNPVLQAQLAQARNDPERALHLTKTVAVGDMRPKSSSR
jgi:hypothetical protein